MDEANNAGVLYVVATPIGHLDDLSRRAENVLKAVQIIAAEDTRRTSRLLAHIGHRAPELLSLHEHNERQIAPSLVERLRSGVDIALVSDAGTPLVNDPGFVLIAQAAEAGITTVPVPGACSITAALSVCPLPCHPFRFVGFLPSKSKARQQVLATYLGHTDALIFLEAPHRIRATLTDLAALSSRPVMLARELTKQFESRYIGSAEEVLAGLDTEPKGEMVVVVAADSEAVQAPAVQHVLRCLSKELPPAQTAKLAAAICGTNKAEMYELALQANNAKA